MTSFICSDNRIIPTIGKTVVANDALSRTGISVRIDEPTPTRIVISALEVIQPGLYGAYLAARAKLGKKKLEKLGLTQPFLSSRERCLPLPGVGVRGTRVNRSVVFCIK